MKLIIDLEQDSALREAVYKAVDGQARRIVREEFNTLRLSVIQKEMRKLIDQLPQWRVNDMVIRSVRELVDKHVKDAVKAEKESISIRVGEEVQKELAKINLSDIKKKVEIRVEAEINKHVKNALK